LALAYAIHLTMRILHISVSDAYGGAATAGWRIHDALRHYGMDSRMLVGRKGRNDPSVTERYSGFAGKAWLRTSPMIEQWLLRMQHSPNPIVHSLGALPTRTHRHSAIAEADIINLHWINQATISIGEIARLRKPIVWTLHDTWPFSGCEHYDDLSHPGRFSRAYSQESRATGHTGVDLDARNFRRKSQLWQHLDITIVTPSQWLGQQSRKSSLFGAKPHHVIPYPIDLARYRPIPKEAARRVLGLDSSCTILSFLGATSDPRKGFDLLAAALWKIPESRRRKLHLLIGGGALSGVPSDLTVHDVGRLSDDVSINVFHAAADIFCAPSRDDNLPLTVMEALASGTPVLAFSIGGMPDMIKDNVSGALIAPFDTGAMAAAIDKRIGVNNGAEAREARESAERIFSPKTIAERYDTLYQSLL
jgi:glycosyltransferase involved in cell wall biosynthesis